MPRPERRLRKLANVSALAMMIFATFSPEALFWEVERTVHTVYRLAHFRGTNSLALVGESG